MRKVDRAGRNFLCVAYLSPINTTVISREGNGDLRRRAGVAWKRRHAQKKIDRCGDRWKDRKRHRSCLFMLLSPQLVLLVSREHRERVCVCVEEEKFFPRFRVVCDLL